MEESSEQVKEKGYQKQSTHVEGNRIEKEELKVELFFIKLKKFGVAYKMNDNRHIGVFFNDKSQIVLDTVLMVFQVSEKIFTIPEKEQRKTLLLSKGKRLVRKVTKQKIFRKAREFMKNRCPRRTTTPDQRKQNPKKLPRTRSRCLKIYYSLI